jgi:competence protein ComEC
MVKPISFGLAIWSLLFMARIVSMGGLDPGYEEIEVDLLQGYQIYLVDRIEAILPTPQSALLSGILLGNKSSLPHFLRQDLADTSTIHMVVVSGQNLTILVGLLMGLSSWLGRRKAITISILGMVIYSVLTGLQIPVLRAFVMAFASIIGQVLGKQVIGWWVLMLTAGLMLLINPNWIFSISFQLSFLATLGLVVVSPVISHHLKKVPSLIRQDLSVSLAAQLMTLPVIASNFASVSLVGIGANLLVLWTIPLVMVSGFLALLASTIPGLGEIVGLVPSVLLTYFIYVVELFASLPVATIKAVDIGFLGWIGYYLVITGTAWFLNSKHQDTKSKQ